MMSERRRLHSRVTWIVRVSLSLLGALLGIECKDIEPPNEDEFLIYADRLTPGFDIGVESSSQKRDWLSEENGVMRMAYPTGQSFGSVFVVTGAVPLVKIREDLSNYATLTVDLRGETGAETLMVSVGDLYGSPSKMHLVIDLVSTWKTYKFSLLDFGTTNLKLARTLPSFAFAGGAAQTVYFRNLKLLKTPVPLSSDSTFRIFYRGFITPGYDLGIAQDTLAGSLNLEVNAGELKINYPPGKQWGSVFFYQRSCLPQDFSRYRKIAMEIRSERARDTVQIGLRNCTNYPDDVGMIITNAWQYREINLSEFAFTYLERVTTICAITLTGSNARIVHIKNIRYIR